MKMYNQEVYVILLYGILQPLCTLNKMLNLYAWLSKKGITMGGGNLMDDVAQETVCVAIKRFNKISIIK